MPCHLAQRKLGDGRTGRNLQRDDCFFDLCIRLFRQALLAGGLWPARGARAGVNAPARTTFAVGLDLWSARPGMEQLLYLKYIYCVSFADQCLFSYVGAPGNRRMALVGSAYS